MTFRQWILSVLILVHLLAITVAAVPRAATGRLKSVPRLDDDPIAAVVEPPLTKVAQAVNDTQRVFRRWTEPVRPYLRLYAGKLLPQYWSMFSTVFQYQRYLRLDYFVETPDGAQVYREIVVPSQPDGVPRLSYRSADKAVRALMSEYFQDFRDDEALDDFEDEESAPPARFMPLIRYFTTRFSRDARVAFDTVTRVEIWYGSIDIPPPGGTPILPAEFRNATLRKYRTLTPTPAPMSALAPAPYSESGITWRLLHTEKLR